MPRGNSEDSSILEYALRALEQERDNLQSKIDNIRRQLGGRNVGSSNTASSQGSGSRHGRGKRVLSDEARKRIAAAQKKRWAAHRRSMKPAKTASKRAAKKAAASE